MPLRTVPTVPGVLRQTSDYFASTFTGAQFTAQAGPGNQLLPDGTSYELLPAADGVAWAEYSVSVPSDGYMSSVAVHVEDTALGGTPPPGMYWVGVAHYARATWEWHGPYTAIDAAIDIADVLSPTDYVSPGGQAHCVVLNYCGTGQTPRPLAVVSVTLTYQRLLPATPLAITYSLGNGHLYRLAAQAGAVPEDLSTELNALSDPGSLSDSYVNSSPDGQWVVLISNRFDAEALGWAALDLVRSDLSTGEAIRAGTTPGNLIHPDGMCAVANGGNLIVYFQASGNPVHQTDLWSVSRASGAAPWGDPVLLTGTSTEDYNTQPALNADGTKLLFDAGPVAYSGDGTKLAEINTDGTGFRIVLDPAVPPPGHVADGALHCGDYTPAGGIVCEANWGGERLWYLAAGGTVPVDLQPTMTNNNSPCVLADGRIVSLWLDRPGNAAGVHELTIANADGSGALVPAVLQNVDVVDVGLGCGGG